MPSLEEAAAAEMRSPKVTKEKVKFPYILYNAVAREGKSTQVRLYEDVEAIVMNTFLGIYSRSV